MAGRKNLTLAAIASLLVCLVPVSCYKVLFIPIPAGSHIVLLSGVAESWVKAGHEAHVIKHHSIPIPSQFKNSGIRYFGHGKQGEEHFTQKSDFTKFVGLMSQTSVFQIMTTLSQYFPIVCSELLENEELFEALKREKYDFVLVDHMPFLRCFHAIPYRLSVPYGSLSVVPPFEHFGDTLQTNFLSNTVPMFYAKEPHFINRLGQFLFINFLNTAVDYGHNREMIERYIKDKPLTDLSTLSRQSKIWLIDMEPMLDAPRHAPPNMIVVGCLSAAPAGPLPDQLKKFADSAKEGLVVVSFGGSLTADFPEEMLRKLLQALSSIKYKVIIRLKTKPSFEIGKNILITTWLPQNDLLGHPNTVLFITHCGLSSINEAIYHGVPMIGFPNQFEQRGNAVKFVDKKYGFKMDRNTFTPEELKTTVDTIMSDPIYRNSIQKAAAIIKSRPYSARAEAVYWMEHVIKYGGDHLIPYTRKLAWYEILMYDIFAIGLAIIAIVLFITVKCCKCIGRICCGKRQPEKKKTS